jgi:lysophospholipase L1-like esterase
MDMKHILCFGDSNTHGCNPNDGSRWPWDIRWTGRLQSLLGPGYKVTEEGLGGRTTVFDDPTDRGKVGMDHLETCLLSHYPLDLVIVMLGTNDAKRIFALSVEDIALGLSRIVGFIQEFKVPPTKLPAPQILVVSPILITRDDPCSCYDASSCQRSQGFATAFGRVAKERDVWFLDAATVAKSGVDGLHMDEQSHEALAHLIFGKTKEILG